MSKRTILIVLSVGLVLGLVSSAWATEVGNIGQSGRFKLELKAEHQVRDVNLKEPYTCEFEEMIVEITYPVVLSLPQQFPESGTEVKLIPSLTCQSFDGEETIDRFYLKGSMAVTDNLQVFGKFGVGRLKFTFFDPKKVLRVDVYEEVIEGLSEGLGSEEREWEYTGYLTLDWLDHPLMGKGDWGTFYGGGIKFIFLRRPDFQVGFDAQYLFQEADCGVNLSEYSLGGGDEEFYFEIAVEEALIHTKTTEWQVAVVASGTMGRLSPYGGIKYSQYGTKYEGDWLLVLESDGESESEVLSGFEFETEPQDYFGVFVGAEYSLTDTCGLSAELRLGDEFAATAGFFRAF